MALLLMLWLTVVPTMVPQGEILVKGAQPAASDATTPVPERGTVATGRYRNAYFGLSYAIPAGWTEQPAGPPPSDGGAYVLTHFAVYDKDQRLQAHVLITAQDLFFSIREAADTKAFVATTRLNVESRYEIVDGPAEVTLAGRRFQRLAYRARRSGLQWRVLATDARCHALTFTFTGTDTAILDAAERALGAITLARTAPACVAGYAAPENILTRTDPHLNGTRHNTIPVRLIIDAAGRVQHVHILSAFPDQAQTLLTTLRTWRFKPYRVGGRAVPVETGMVFGMPQARLAATRAP